MRRRFLESHRPWHWELQLLDDVGHQEFYENEENLKLIQSILGDPTLVTIEKPFQELSQLKFLTKLCEIFPGFISKCREVKASVKFVVTFFYEAFLGGLEKIDESLIAETASIFDGIRILIYRNSSKDISPKRFLEVLSTFKTAEIKIFVLRIQELTDDASMNEMKALLQLKNCSISSLQIQMSEGNLQEWSKVLELSKIIKTLRDVNEIHISSRFWSAEKILQICFELIQNPLLQTIILEFNGYKFAEDFTVPFFKVRCKMLHLKKLSLLLSSEERTKLDEVKINTLMLEMFQSVQIASLSIVSTKALSKSELQRLLLSTSEELKCLEISTRDYWDAWESIEETSEFDPPELKKFARFPFLKHLQIDSYVFDFVNVSEAICYLDCLEALSLHLKVSNDAELRKIISSVAPKNKLQKVELNCKYGISDATIWHSLMHECPFLQKLVLKIPLESPEFFFNSLSSNKSLEHVSFQDRLIVFSKEQVLSLARFLLRNSDLVELNGPIQLQSLPTSEVAEGLTRNHTLCQLRISVSKSICISELFIPHLTQTLIRNCKRFRAQRIWLFLRALKNSVTKNAKEIYEKNCCNLILKFLD